MPINLLADEMEQRPRKAPINLLADEMPPERNLMQKIGGLPLDIMKDLLSGTALRNVAQGALTGLGQGGQTIASLATGGRAPTVNMDEMFSGVGVPTQGGSGALEKGLGSYLPYGISGGGSLLGQIGAGLAHGAATTSPEEMNAGGYLPSGKTGGALKEAVLNTLLHGAGKTLEALRPSKSLRGNLTPEELKSNVEATQGTTTGLGDVIGSPTLKQVLENEISDMPFSGTKQTMQRTAKQIQEKANQIGSDLNLGKSDQFDLQEALKDASNKARNEKNSKFRQVNEEADKLGVNVGRQNFSKVAEDELAEINSSPELKHELPGDFVSSITRFAKNKEGNSLKRTDIFRGVLGDKANEFYRSGQDKLAGVFGKLKDALVKDREAAIENSEHPTLKAMNDEAHRFYKENYAPFKHPDIVKFTRQGGDADLLLPHFLRKGQNDRSVLLSRLTDQLKSGETRDLPAQLYLSKAIEGDQVNPRTLARLYNDLGENQKEVLIPDQNLRKRLENYSRLVRLNAEPLDLMRNPKTGFRGVQSAVHTLMGIGGYGAAGPLGAMAGVALPGVAVRPLTKALTSPSIRENLVRAMLENKPKFSWKGTIQGSQTLAQALAAALAQGNQ